ncbi:MAG: hypothetical protein K2N65_01985, partial [Anaeroplasmataceae bacterium]|nr:hypothetical protein [Anaeroplasmataceae bacterium]
FRIISEKSSNCYSHSFEFLSGNNKDLKLLLNNYNSVGNGGPIITSPTGSHLKIFVEGDQSQLSLESTIGYTSIQAYDLTFFSDIAKLTIIGGKGRNGQNGLTSAVNKNTECWSRKGDDGENGYAGITCHNVTFNSSNITIKGGSGGRGGDGGVATGNGWSMISNNHMAIFSGGDGGHGGSGGNAIEYTGEIFNASLAILVGGAGGHGGTHGEHNNTNMYYHGDRPWFGEDGKPGDKGANYKKIS